MTTPAFDPYHKWLGIPPQEQPPNLYRLLGISLFESDADVIGYAADQRMALLRSIAAGPNSAVSQRLLNEVAAAKVTLLKSEKRQAYDAELRAKLAPRSQAEFVPTSVPPSSPAARLRRRTRSPLPWVIFAAISCATIAGLLFALNQQGKGPQNVRQNANGSLLTQREEPQQSPDRTSRKTLPNVTELPLADSKAPSRPGETVRDAIPRKRQRTARSKGQQSFTTLNSGAVTSVYWQDEQAQLIRRASIDGSSVDDLITVGSGGTGICIDIDTERVYWTTSTPPSIHCANLDGTNRAVILSSGLHLPLGIAVDSLNGKIYWADQGPHKISRANLDGTNVEVLVQSITEHPHDIALDAKRQNMYWTDSRTDKIYRSNLDGTAIVDIAQLGTTPGNASPRGIAIDVLRDKLYWCNQGEGQIQRANVDGSMIEDVIHVPGWNGPDGLAVDEVSGKIYWTGVGSIEKVQSANLDGSNVEDLATQGHGILRGIDVSPASRAPSKYAERVSETPPLSSIVSASVNAKSDSRSPVPLQDDLARAEKAIDDLMRTDFAKAKTNPLKAELAKRLFELGQGTRDDAVAAYVQLRKAIDLAAESAQVELAFEIIETLAERYEVDPLAEKEKSLATAGRLAKNAQEFHQLTEIWVLLTGEAIERDDYELAMRTANEARRCARLSADAVFVKIVESGTQNLQQLKEAYAAAKPAKERLAADPTNGEAAAEWGRFLCAYKGAWKSGLALWAKTSDEASADLIKRDLAAPIGSDERVKLGDDWFAAAESETEELPRVTLKARAAHWYKEALPQLTGLTKARVEKRVAEIYEATSPFVRGRVVNVLGLVDPKRHALRGEWGRRGTQLGLAAPISHGGFYVPVALKGDFDLVIEFRRGKDSADWTNVVLPIGGGWVALQVVLGDKPKVSFANVPPHQNKAPEVSSRLVSGGRHRIKLVVRQVGERAKVTADINNRPVLVFDDVIRANAGSWVIGGGGKAPPNTIGLETADATLIYESAMLRLISGTAELLP